METWPQTKLGRLACWLELAFLAWWFLNLAFIQLKSNFDTMDARWAFIAIGLLGMATGLVGGVLAVVALARKKERGLLVWLCLLPLALVVTFLLGELLVPH